MNEHQRRLWERMISSLDDYIARRTGFSRMVDDLEGIIDSGEYRDNVLVDKWYDRWTDLETWRAAAEGSDVQYSDVAAAVQAMHKFLKDELRD